LIWKGRVLVYMGDELQGKKLLGQFQEAQDILQNFELAEKYK